MKLIFKNSLTALLFSFAFVLVFSTGSINVEAAPLNVTNSVLANGVTPLTIAKGASVVITAKTDSSATSCTLSSPLNSNIQTITQVIRTTDTVTFTAFPVSQTTTFTVTCEFTDTYTWKSGIWGACTWASGGASETRTVVCENSSGTPVADSFCDPATRPSTSQSCTVPAVNGVCNNTTRNACLTGTPNDAAIPDTGGQFRWLCEGSNGGTTSACQTAQPTYKIYLDGVVIRSSTGPDSRANGSYAVFKNISNGQSYTGFFPDTYTSPTSIDVPAGPYQLMSVVPNPSYPACSASSFNSSEYGGIGSAITVDSTRPSALLRWSCNAY